ncbi:MAG: formimidoylglutamase [Nitrospinaceae bacterium]
MKEKRIGNILTPGNQGDILLLGFPHDEGVVINGGRAGARRGPKHFRSWLQRYGVTDNPEIGVDLSHLKIADMGDIDGTDSLEAAHGALTERVGKALRTGGIPFVVGGGNDQSYPNASALLGYSEKNPVGVINIDAHFDVRPLMDGRAHSGSSFRQLLEDSRFSGENFIEFASQGSQCSREHADYIRSKKGRILWLNNIQKEGHVLDNFEASVGNLAWRGASIFVSFDLDSMAGVDAPGVSCPAIFGLTALEAVNIAFIAGRHPSVALFDLSEYNPEIEDERTGRLAAGMFYYFCLGVATRKEPG